MFAVDVESAAEWDGDGTENGKRNSGHFGVCQRQHRCAGVSAFLNSFVP